MKKISFVVPVYNSRESLPELVERIFRVFTAREATVECILVNDGSTDGVGQVATSLASKNKSIKYIELARNFGQHNALLTGIRIARGDFILCLDDDLQTPPEESKKLVTQADKHGFDVVFGQYTDTHDGWVRRMGTALNNWMAQALLGKPDNLTLTSFFLMNAFVAQTIRTYQGPYVYLPGLILRSTNRIGGAVVAHNRRKYGRSTYSLFGLVRLWFTGFTHFSALPMRFATVIGVSIAAVGFVLAGYLVIKRLIVPEVPLGWTSVMVAVIALGGLALTFLGLIGEYISSVLMSINNQPQAIIRKTKNL